MYVLIGSFILSMLCSFFLTKKLIPFFKRNDIIALDLHKKDKPKIANSGGIPVFISVIFGLMFFIAIQTFIFNTTSQILYLFAGMMTILLISLIGFFDDLNISDVIKGKTKIRKGLKQWQKPLLTLPAAIPLMVVSAGVSTMSIPFIGVVNFGIIYPLILIPIGVVGAANAVNLLGGFNGSEAGMGVVYCLGLASYALFSNEIISAVIFLSTTGALLGFLFFNWYPAKILSGDSLTYGLGATIATGVIIGNMEKAGVIILIPFIIEFFLKLRSKFKAHSLGKLRKDGTLEAPYGKNIYSLTHILMNFRKLKERQVTIGLILIEIIFVLGLLII
ncbi:MAG: glycosyl transferase family 4 [Candidatus Aenigmarchaeota archaeon]|nr:glycosyl transferase family 4 [Candidatus Aenigmarchaeota archaeon]